jgi:3-hydroxyacyl-CoA dehydrogenase
MAEDSSLSSRVASKEQVIGMVHGFYPWYKQTVQEIVPFEHGMEAIMATARQLAQAR